MEEYGVEVVVGDIKWSGFWSQGDGASFVGHVKLKKYMEKTGDDKTYPAIAFWAEYIDVWLERNDSRYCHENTVTVEYNARDCITEQRHRASRGNSVLVAAGAAMTDLMHASIEGYIVRMEEALRLFMRGLYSRLYEAYEWRTSDDEVFATLKDLGIWVDDAAS
jgi:hypothetical protein